MSRDWIKVFDDCKSGSRDAGANGDALVARSRMHFLSRDDIFQSEKPFRFHFDPGAGLPRTNFLLESRPVVVHDIRPALDSLSLDVQGFEVLTMDSKLEYEDFDNMGRVNDVYANELKELLCQHLGAKHIHLLDFQIRRRHPTFPVSTGEKYKHTQPNSLAHIDVTLDSVKDIIEESFGDLAGQICASRFQCITIWRPLKGPVCDWPLAVCDARTVSEEDIVPADAIYPTYVAENCMTHFSEAQRWCYLSKQTPSELLVFKAVDSDAQLSRPCPHAACPMEVSEAYGERESVDVRALVFYANVKYPKGRQWENLS